MAPTSRPSRDRTSVTSERFIAALNGRGRRALRRGLTGEYDRTSCPGGEAIAASAGSARESDVERRGVCVAALRRGQQQLAVVDPVRGIPHDPLRSLLRVRRLREHLRVERVVEEELRGEFVGRRLDLEVYVHGAQLVPAGIDRRELHLA